MGTKKVTGRVPNFDPLKEADTIDLIEELASRSAGHVIAVQLNGPEGEYVSKIGVDDVISTGGLLRAINKRFDIYLEDTFKEDYDVEE